MTSGPRRLRDDPDFQWETGCDLADEVSIVPPGDLSAVKAGLLAHIAAAPIPVETQPAVLAGGVGAGMARLGLFGLGGGVLLVGAYLLGAQSTQDRAPPPPPPPQMDTAPTRVPPTLVPAARTPTAAVVAPGAGGPPPTRSIARRSMVPQTAAPAGTADEQPLPVVAPPTVSAVPVRSSPQSGVAAQMRMFEPAVGLLQDGEADAAARAFQDYLRAWPQGDLRDEAELGLLQALFASGDAARTAQLAARLEGRTSLHHRRLDILRLRAESLILLSRCDEALVLADGLPNRVAAPIRRGCRQQRRGAE